jgi:hypothetical protein
MDPSPRAALPRAWGGFGRAGLGKPLWSPSEGLTTEQNPARFDGRGYAICDHCLGSLRSKPFILLTSQIENFGLTEGPAKVLVSAQQG